MKNFKFTILLAALIFAIGSISATAQTPTIQLQPVATGFSSPLYITNAKDASNRLFVVQRGGIIKVLQPGATTGTDFLNITTRVLSGGERGLLGLAFHPRYTENRRFFVYYTRQPDGAIQIAEYKVSATNPNVAETTEKIIITIPHPTNSNHNGGTVEFGPDGYLYAGPGDGGGGNDPPNNAQNINQLLGKIIRINIDVPEGSTQPYLIPPDNPFAGSIPGADEIYAVGMRNPYRFSFDRGGSRQLYAADVGQNSLEEIDIITLGGNYGWRVYEGTQCTNLDPGLCNPANFIPPIAQYSSGPETSRCSITGGSVYRGRRGTFPQGAYIYADYCTGEIFMLQGTTQTVLLDAPNFNVVAIGEDEAGELYITNLTAGTVEKIVNPNAVPLRRPIADFDGDGKTDLSVFRGGGGAAGPGIWYILNSSNNTLRSERFGLDTDILTPADFDGDGRTDIAVFRDGNWYSLNSSNGAFRAFQFGTTGDIPVASDYDGDGRDDYAVFRSGNWYVQTSLTNQFRAMQWGVPTDTPVPADYDGDGRTDFAVYRREQNGSGMWYVFQSQTNSFSSIQWGSAATVHIPTPADFDGDGKADHAVIVAGQRFYARRSSNGTLYEVQLFGGSENRPAIGDYDGDGRADVATTASGGSGISWQIIQSTSGNRFVQFGAPNDRVIPPFDIP